ncbi:MAG TPA: hypothetical protein VNJ11_12945, partial [Bryobacteraceae bacterium]|nr:hypothetical protein [Bryobacteraceae bacterium]
MSVPSVTVTLPEMNPCPHRMILGMRVDATSYAEATRLVVEWARRGESRMVCCASVNNVMQACEAPAFRALMNAADLV